MVGAPSSQPCRRAPPFRGRAPGARTALAAPRERTVMVRHAIIGLAVAAVLGALAVYLMLRWYRQRTGFETARAGGGRIVASDTGVEPAALLRDPGLGLRGRPDYLFQFEVAGRALFVPMELKPGRRSRRVYESDA